MKFGLCQVNRFQFIITYSNAFWIDVGIQFGIDGQAALSGRVSDEIDDDLMADQWLSTPVHADVTEHAMLNLIPFARAWREVTDGDMQPALVGEFLQSHFPQANPIAVTSSAVGSDHEFRGVGVAPSPHFVPPAANAFHSKF